MKQYFAPVETGVESSIDDDGVRRTGTLTVGVTVYEPGDTVPTRALPLTELLRKYIDPATGLIRLPIHQPTATMDPKLLTDVPPTAMATLSFRFWATGPSVEGASCALPSPGGARREVRPPEAAPR